MTKMTRTSQVELLMRACGSTRLILDKVGREQLALPTPCRDWPVHDLIEHIVRATDFFADVAEQGSSPEGREWPNYADGDFVRSFNQQAGRMVTAFSTPGAMERIMVLPNGAQPGRLCIQVATGETFVHGWDLAKATGREMPPDQGVAEALLASQWPSMSAEVRNAHPSVFAPEIAVPREAPAIDQLVGFLGRAPSWPSGQ
jgi:uncharacterized protein (TIGR03086 family)